MSRLVLILSGWGVLLLGVLQLKHLPINGDHSVCGPWGCGPPIPVLLAVHGFWCVLLGVPASLFFRNASVDSLFRVGWCLLMLGVTGLLLILVWELVPVLPHWAARVRDLPAAFFLHRFLFALVTLVDVPVLPLLLIGSTSLYLSRRQTAIPAVAVE